MFLGLNLSCLDVKTFLHWRSIINLITFDNWRWLITLFILSKVWLMVFINTKINCWICQQLTGKQCWLIISIFKYPIWIFSKKLLILNTILIPLTSWLIFFSRSIITSWLSFVQKNFLSFRRRKITLLISIRQIWEINEI
jgi:hypothetical protein